MIRPVGEIIRERREELGMSKSELARRLGCSPQNIDSLEGRKSIDFELAIKINSVLEFDLFTFYQIGAAAKDLEIAFLKNKVIELQDRLLSEKSKKTSNHLNRDFSPD